MDEDSILTDDTIIWRYMNLDSFLSLISGQKLSFCRFDRLKSMDPYEGADSIYELEQQDFTIKMLNEIGKANGNILLKNTKLIHDSHRSCLEDINKQYFVNCWHINNYESVAMWDSFTSSKTGIAIRSTLGNLKKSIMDNYDLKYEKVEYVDLITYTGNTSPLLRKTKYFEHENELRVYFTFIKERVEEPVEIEIEGKKSFGMISRINNPDRMEISVNLSQLINGIVVSPKSEEWFLSLITKLLCDYNVRITPNQSDIKVNNIKIKSGEYSLINIENQFKKLIENSSEGQAAKGATYRLNYNETSGEIKGCYPSNLDYKVVPEPYINVSWEEWKRWCNNPSSARIDIITKKITFDN